MNQTVLLSAFGALLTGIAIALQSTLNGRVASGIGAFPTGIYSNIAGGTVGAIIVGISIVVGGSQAWRLTTGQALMLGGSGVLGIVIVSGVAFSVARVGVAAGLGGIIMGQMLMGAVADATGIGGGDPIQFDLRRIAGLLLMGASVYLLLPRR